MILLAPNRQTFKDAYYQFTGVELSDSFIGYFFKLAGMIKSSSVKTNRVVISWDGPYVEIRKRESL